MGDTNLSPGVRLAWQLAGDLAIHEGSSILPRHLIFGMCSLEKLLNARADAARADDLVKVSQVEIKQFCEISRRHGVNFTSLRRGLRLPAATLDKRAASKQTLRVSRSPAAKQLFETSLRLSSLAGFSEVDLRTLLKTVIETTDPEIETVIGDQKTALLEVIADADFSTT